MRVRLLLAVLALALVGFPGFCRPAVAQMIKEHDATALRSFHGNSTRIRRSFQSDSQAREVFRTILQAADLGGLESEIDLRASANVGNAVAFVEDTPEGLKRYIFYNAFFMQQLQQKSGNYWSLVAVLAHELGHHVRLHTVASGRDHQFELQADFQAGVILGRMGATLDEAVSLFNGLPVEATETHPGRDERVQMATLGWIEGAKASSEAEADRPSEIVRPPPSLPSGESRSGSETTLADLGCDRLWRERNAIFHRNAYCFQSARGRQTFSNEGCFRDQDQAWSAMNASDRQLVRAIQEFERAKGC